MNAWLNDIYRRALKVYGDPEEAKIAAAQAALETGYGKSAPGGNLFGIKSTTGKGITTGTTEVRGGKTVRERATWEVHGSPEQSISARLDFLKRNPRYRKAGYFDAKTAVEKAAALKRAGYATDPNYVGKLSAIIKQIDPNAVVDARMASVDYGEPGSTDIDRSTPAIPPYSLPDRWSQNMETPPQVPRQPTYRDSLPPELLQLLEGNSGKPDPYSALLNFGIGVLNAGGGPGAGNWVGAGLSNMANAIGSSRQSDLYAAQTQLGLMKMLGMQAPSASERVRGMITEHYVNPQTGEGVTIQRDAYSGAPIHPVTQRPMSQEEFLEMTRGMVPSDRLANPSELGLGRDSGGAYQSPFSKVDLSEVTPESAAVYAQSGNPADLEWVEPPQAESGDDTPYEITRPDGTVTYSRGFPADVPPGARVSKIGTGGGSGGGKGNVNLEKLDAAIADVEALDAVMFGRDGNGSGAFTTGSGEPVSGAWGRLFKGVANGWNKLTQGNMSAEMYERQLASIAGTLAKAFGDTGTLSEGDIKRALDAMPRADLFPDSTAYAMAAKEELLRKLKIKRAAVAGNRLAEPPHSEFDIDAYNRAIEAATSVEEIRAIQERFGVQ